MRSFAELIAAEEARDPVDIPVPQPVLRSLEEAASVLLIGHIGPDGDCAGAALALAHGLEAMGKRVDVCIDDVISGFLRRIDTGGRIRSAAELEGGAWDVAVLVDVADHDRVGDANERLLPAVGSLVIIDHHRVEVERDGFAVPEHVELITWVDASFPAASLMVAATLARWRQRLGAVNLAELYTPALAGFATDIGFGRFARIDSEHLRYFKHMLIEGGVSLEALLEQLRFRVPQSVWDLAVNGVLPSQSEVQGAEIDTLRQLEARGVLVEEQVIDGLAVVVVPRPLLDALVVLGQVEESDLVDRDVLYALKKERMSRLREAGASMTVLLTEGQSGRVWVSIRSRDGAARELAEHLGGGGHDRAAGASLQNTAIDEVRDRVIIWVRSRG